MLNDISFGDFGKVFLMMAVFVVLLIGLIDGIRNLDKGSKNYKEIIIDFIFGIDIFLAIWLCVSFFFALLAGLGAIIIFAIIPPAVILICGISLFIKSARKYKYIIIGVLVAGLVPTIVFFDGICSLGFDILKVIF
jgi:hypothetical protein